MSLFVCEECGCIENTATSRFWFRGEGKALCSGCDPQAKGWHGLFPQRQFDPDIDEPAYRDGEWQEVA
jgi:hypothetical protein